MLKQNFEIGRPLPKGKNKKVLGLMKDELGGQILQRICWITSKNISLSKKQQ